MNHAYSRDRQRFVFSTATALALHFLAIIMLELLDWQSRIDESKLSAPIMVELADTEERNPGPKVEQQTEKPEVRQEVAQKPEPQPEAAPAAPEQVAVAKPAEPPKPQPAPQPKPQPQPQPKVAAAPPERDYAELVQQVAPIETQANRTRRQIERAPAVEPKNDVQVPKNFVQGSSEQTAPQVQTKPQESAPVASAAPAEPERDLGFLDQAIERSMTEAPGSAQQRGGSRSGPVASASSGSSGPVSDIQIEWEEEGDERKIEYRPDLDLPGWVGEEGLLLRLNISLSVVEDGRPQGVRITRSSGYPEIDAMVESWVRRWKFTPVRGAGTASGSFPLTIRSR